MANNRMVLVCNVCNPTNEWDYFSKGILVIAKWYPAGGFIGGDDGAYYSGDGFKSLPERLSKFLYDHQHMDLASEHYKAGAGQENPIRIEYESIGLPILDKSSS